MNPNLISSLIHRVCSWLTIQEHVRWGQTCKSLLSINKDPRAWETVHADYLLGWDEERLNFHRVFSCTTQHVHLENMSDSEGCTIMARCRNLKTLWVKSGFAGGIMIRNLGFLGFKKLESLYVGLQKPETRDIYEQKNLERYTSETKSRWIMAYQSPFALNIQSLISSTPKNLKSLSIDRLYEQFNHIWNHCIKCHTLTTLQIHVRTCPNLSFFPNLKHLNITVYHLGPNIDTIPKSLRYISIRCNHYYHEIMTTLYSLPNLLKAHIIGCTILDESAILPLWNRGILSLENSYINIGVVGAHIDLSYKQELDAFDFTSHITRMIISNPIPLPLKLQYVSLKTLSLCNINITDLKCIEGCPQLTHLVIQSCSILQSITSLRSCSRLERLCIENVYQLDDFCPLLACTELKRLTFVNTLICDLDMIANCHALQTIKVINCNDLCCIQGLRHCPDIKQIYIWSDCDIKDFSPLGYCSRVLRIRIYGPLIHDFTMLQKLSELKVLEVKRKYIQMVQEQLRSRNDIWVRFFGL